MNTSVSSMKEFCSLNRLKNLINEPTCYKNYEKPISIDLILTNQPTLFQCNTVFETGLSDFHLLTVTEFKMSFQKCEPHIITTGTTKTMTMMSLDLKFKPFVL